MPGSTASPNPIAAPEPEILSINVHRDLLTVATQRRTPRITSVSHSGQSRLPGE